MFALDIDGYGGFIQYETQYERINSFILALLATSGFLLALVFLVVTLKSKLYQSSNNYIYIISLGFAGSMLASVFTGLSWFNLSKGGWAGSSFVCLWSSRVAFVSQIATLLSITAATMNLYLIVIWQIYLSLMQTWILVGFIWIAAVVLGLWGLFLPFEEMRYLESLQPSKLVCLLTWWEGRIGTVTAVVLCLIVMAILLSFILYAYYSIFSFYYSSLRKAPAFATTTLANQVASKPLSTMEMKLLKRAVFICASDFLLSAPYLVKIAVECATQTPSSSQVDAFCTLCFALFYVCMPIQMLLFDSHIRNGTVELLYLNELKQSLSGFQIFKPSSFATISSATKSLKRFNNTNAASESFRQTPQIHSFAYDTASNNIHQLQTTQVEVTFNYDDDDDGISGKRMPAKYIQNEWLDISRMNLQEYSSNLDLVHFDDAVPSPLLPAHQFNHVQMIDINESFRGDFLQ